MTAGLSLQSFMPTQAVRRLRAGGAHLVEARQERFAVLRVLKLAAVRRGAGSGIDHGFSPFSADFPSLIASAARRGSGPKGKSRFRREALS